MKSIVAAPFIPPALFIASHRAASAAIYADQIKCAGAPDDEVVLNLGGRLVEDFNKFDRLYVYHGNDRIDRNASLNLYGGCEHFPYAWNTRNFSRFKGEVISLGMDFPDYHTILSKKLEYTIDRGKQICQEFLDTDMDNLLDMQNRARTIKYPHLTSNIVIGDSHSICMYRPDWMVNSVPYKTLHGALDIGLKEFVIDAYVDMHMVSNIEIYFGNIDIRHHLLRSEDPETHTTDLCQKYVDQALNLYQYFPNLQSVKIYEPLPIENESRPLPTSGYFKGKPFYGTWKQRNEIRNLFNRTIDKCLESKGKDVQLVKWTDYLLNSAGELDLKKMEYKKSVHLSRASYPFWTGQHYNDAVPVRARTSKKSTLESFFE